MTATTTEGTGPGSAEGAGEKYKIHSPGKKIFSQN
jgi:hypothetical protein